MKVPVVEVFESIQGEGRSIGSPCIFVRFWGCNLRCRFAGESCDTPYAVINGKEQVFMAEPKDVVDTIKTFKSKHIVFTGGEPCLYQEFIDEVINQLNEVEHFYFYEMETNGTISLNKSLKTKINLFNISIKLKSSNQENEGFDEARYNKAALSTFPVSHFYFKFVATTEEDIEEIKNIQKDFPWVEIYLMPEGMTREDVIKSSLKTVQLCIKYGWRFCPREHIMIWDSKKGV